MKPKLFINSCYPSLRFVWLPLWVEFRPYDHFHRWPVFRRSGLDIWLLIGTLRVRWKGSYLYCLIFKQ